MPRFEDNVLNNNSTGNRKISITVHRKGKPVAEENSTEAFAETEALEPQDLIKVEKEFLEINALQNNIIKVEKEFLEINTLQNNIIENKNSSIFGIITDIRGLPLEDAVVQLRILIDGSYRTISELQSNNNGEYLFANLPIGLYSLTIYKDGFINYQSRNINITFGESIGLNISLQDDLRNQLGSIHGTIRDEATNLPLENILVALYSIVNNHQLLKDSTITNGEGRYAFSLIPPGNYVIKATAFRKEEG